MITTADWTELMDDLFGGNRVEDIKLNRKEEARGDRSDDFETAELVRLVIDGKDVD